MTDTSIAILQKAADLGLALSFTPPDTLDVKASGHWAKSFADTLRTHKPHCSAMSRRRYPHRDVTCVYDGAGNVFETHEHADEWSAPSDFAS